MKTGQTNLYIDEGFIKILFVKTKVKLDLRELRSVLIVGGTPTTNQPTSQPQLSDQRS